MSASSSLNNNLIIDTFIGQTAFTTKIDDSPKLQELISEAERAQDLPFTEKLGVIQQLAVKAMVNAWEAMSQGDPAGKRLALSMVMDSYHPLSDALNRQLGCCRYQSALFLVLGAAAKLGSKHLLESVNLGRMQTCFNTVYDDAGTKHIVSIYALSLSDQKNSYIQDATVFEKPSRVLPGHSFLGYTIQEGVVTCYSRPSYHLEGNPPLLLKTEEHLAQCKKVVAQIHAEPGEGESVSDWEKKRAYLPKFQELIQQREAELAHYSPVI